ncbi:hypothetical protein [Psychrobacter sp. PAMC 21119]|uniref:hypothetical protein n=1 Tax=Psychrobacter sp. PAMC 21119 TaxID=1112209 RepID=UPI000288964F|nr:hypothetical protein [Psychrobacter sp. PAMC 21119]
MALLDTLKDTHDNKYISFWKLVSNIIDVDESKSDNSYASNETYFMVAEALLRLKIHEKIRYFIYDPDDFTFKQIDKPKIDEAKLFLKTLLPNSGKKLEPTEVIKVQNQFKNYFWLKESIEQVLPNGSVNFINPIFFDSGEYHFLDITPSSVDIETLIKLKHLQDRVNELEAEKSTGSFSVGTPTVEHGEPKTYEHLVEALTAANAKIKQQAQDINRLSDQLKEQADKPLRYNSEMGVARMLYAILTEHKYDLSATKGKANSLIEKASQLHGTPVARNFIAKWIELSNQAKSDSTK